MAEEQTPEYDRYRESGEAPKATQPRLVCELGATPVLYLGCDCLGEERSRGSSPSRYECLPWADSNSKTLKGTIIGARWNFSRTE